MRVALQSDGGRGTVPWAIAPVEVRLLGGFELLVAGRRAAAKMPCQRLLAFLALAGRRLRRAYVAGTLWPDASEARAAGSLRSALWSLKRLDARVVVSDPPLLWLAEHAVVDVHAQVELARHINSPEPTSDLIGRGLFEKELLPDWYDDWVGEPREQWRQVRLHALEAAEEPEGRLEASVRKRLLERFPEIVSRKKS